MSTLSWPIPGFKRLRFENTFSQTPSLFHENVQPTPISQPQLVMISGNCCEAMGLETSELDQEILRDWLNGTKRVEGEQRLATRYAGHQFGVWAGQLGDGRAISLGELVKGDQRWEIQTKGSGKTPFSRMGDGKAVIRSSVREFLCSEAMHALRIPTTRALALIVGNDPVERETIERSALIARVFPTNLRFGHFEYAYHFNHPAELRELTDYLRRQFFQDTETTIDMLHEIGMRTADLIAAWQTVGFCHGVMNSDNMSALGITIDYGPFGFMEDFDINHICNHSDHQGRYSFVNQPAIGFWNLERFLICFSDSVEVSKLEDILRDYQVRFELSWLEGFRKKLGIEAGADPHEDLPLFNELLQILHRHSWDYTFFFREISRYEMTKPDSLKGLFQHYERKPDFLAWLKNYDALLGQRQIPNRIATLLQTNPKFVLKNYIANEIIADVESGSTGKLKAWYDVLTRPYEEHGEFDKFAKPTPDAKKHVAVSCSS